MKGSSANHSSSRSVFFAAPTQAAPAYNSLPAPRAPGGPVGNQYPTAGAYPPGTNMTVA